MQIGRKLNLKKQTNTWNESSVALWGQTRLQFYSFILAMHVRWYVASEFFSTLVPSTSMFAVIPERERELKPTWKHAANFFRLHTPLTFFKLACSKVPLIFVLLRFLLWVFFCEAGTNNKLGNTLICFPLCCFACLMKRSSWHYFILWFIWVN